MMDATFDHMTHAPLRDRLIEQYRRYERAADARPCMFNTPNENEEAGYHLAKPRPWNSFYASAVLTCPYWLDVQALILQAIGSCDPQGAFDGKGG